MFRNLRTFSSLSRSIFRPRSQFLQHEGAITVRRVRLVRPIFTRRRLQTLTVWTASIGSFWYIMDSMDDDEEEDDEESNDKVLVQSRAVEVRKKKKEFGTGELEDEDEDVEEDNENDEEDEEEAEAQDSEDAADDEVEVPDTPPEGSWFIPLGPPRERPKTFYKGSDPEWQSFVEFSKDMKRSMFIRNELAGLVGKYMADLRTFQKVLGTPIQTGKYWLDIDFPDGPPPEYERAGLEITDDYIAWTVRPVSSINVSRLHSALWPEATVSSLWASSQALWQLQLAKIKDLLNIKPEEEARKPRYPPGYVNIPQLAQPKNKDEAQPTATGPEVSQSKAIPPPSTVLPAGSERSKILWPLPPIPKPSTEMTTASMAFKDNLAKSWKSASAPAPRGTFMVSGLVEVQGPKGVCVLDVKGAYHPQMSMWVAIGMGVRRVQRRKQAPKGGR